MDERQRHLSEREAVIVVAVRQTITDTPSLTPPIATISLHSPFLFRHHATKLHEAEDQSSIGHPEAENDGEEEK